jgi:hypothetical protein
MMWALFNIIACDCLAKLITTVTGKQQILYCDAIYYVRRLRFNKNHELEHRSSVLVRGLNILTIIKRSL